jgi:hypothetical protein
MRLTLPFAMVLLTASASLASPSVWNAPDSIRPAPWSACAPAPSVVIPSILLAPIVPEIPVLFPVDPGSGEPAYANPNDSDL